LLDQPHTTDALHQVCGEAAALFGNLGPVALGHPLEAPGGDGQQWHRGGQAEEEGGFDSPQHHCCQATAQQGTEQLRRALHEQGLECIHISVGARDDAPGAGLVEVAHRQCLDVGEHLDSQVVEHANGCAPGNPL